MLKLLTPIIASEFGTAHGHVPFFLRHLSNLNPAAKQIVMFYLRWRMERMSTMAIHNMLESGQVSIADLDLFAAEWD